MAGDNRLKAARAVFDNVRLYDLVRYQRHELFDAGLITIEEWTALAVTGADSARRLEDYDQLRKRLIQAESTRTAAQAEATRQTLLAREYHAQVDDLTRKLAECEAENTRVKALSYQLASQITHREHRAQLEIRQAFDEGFGLSKLNGPIESAWARSEARQNAAG